MTFTTKAQLRAQLATATADADFATKTLTQLDPRLRAAEDKLTNLGYIETVDHRPYGGIWYKSPLLKEREAAEHKAHQAELRDRATQGREEGRREALQAVIDALELTDYGYRDPESPQGIHSYLANYDAYGLPAPSHTDRLWEDLNTALDVREQAKNERTRRKTADKIAGLAGHAKPGDRIAFHFVDLSAPTPKTTTAKATAKKTAAKPAPKKGAKK